MDSFGRVVLSFCAGALAGVLAMDYSLDAGSRDRAVAQAALQESRLLREQVARAADDAAASKQAADTLLAQMEELTKRVALAGLSQDPKTPEPQAPEPSLPEVEGPAAPGPDPGQEDDE
jgi:hypothetical protein